jgi:hypothetical protein
MPPRVRRGSAHATVIGMYIGGSLVLLAVGAVLSLAVEDRVDAVDLVMVGYIFMAVGVLGLIVSLIVSGQNRGGGVRPR